MLLLRSGALPNSVWAVLGGKVLLERPTMKLTPLVVRLVWIIAIAIVLVVIVLAPMIGHSSNGPAVCIAIGNGAHC